MADIQFQAHANCETWSIDFEIIQSIQYFFLKYFINKMNVLIKVFFFKLKQKNQKKKKGEWVWVQIKYPVHVLPSTF